MIGTCYILKSGKVIEITGEYLTQVTGVVYGESEQIILKDEIVREATHDEVKAAKPQINLSFELPPEDSFDND